MVRAARIELASLAWKAGILAIIRRPLTLENYIRFWSIIESINGTRSFMFETNENNKVDHLHSSAYAKVANGDSFGSQSTRSFEDRAHMERNRQTVQRYGDSLIGQNHMRDTARIEGNTQGGEARTPRIPAPLPRRRLGVSGRGSVAPIAPRQSFREPGGRGYNPYA